MNMSKLKLGITSTIAISSMTIALGCAGLTYLVLQRLKGKNAADVLNYLTIDIITSEEDCDEAITKLRRYSYTTFYS